MKLFKQNEYLLKLKDKDGKECRLYARDAESIKMAMALNAMCSVYCEVKNIIQQSQDDPEESEDYNRAVAKVLELFNTVEDLMVKQLSSIDN